MPTKKATFKAEWDEELENKIEKKIDEWSSSCFKKGSGSSAGATAGGGAVYGLGMIGALVYYMQTASGFWGVITGILKAIFWPGFVVYELLKYLGM